MKQQELGTKLAELRKAKGLTQEEVVAKCNIAVRTLQRIEAGEVIPRSYTLHAILSVLEVDYSDFAAHLNYTDKIQDSLESAPKKQPHSLKHLIAKWSFAVYIFLLFVFSFLIKYGMPWHFYILPVIVIFLINTQELETNL